MGFFCPKQKMYELKIYRGVVCHDNDAEFEEESTCQLKIDMRNVTNFDMRTTLSMQEEEWGGFLWGL